MTYKTFIQWRCRFGWDRGIIQSRDDLDPFSDSMDEMKLVFNGRKFKIVWWDVLFVDYLIISHKLIMI